MPIELMKMSFLTPVSFIAFTMFFAIFLTKESMTCLAILPLAPKIMTCFIFQLLRRHFIEAIQRIQGSGVSHPGQQLSDQIRQNVFVVSNIEIAMNVSLDLRFNSTQGDE